MTQREVISLREHLEARIDHERELVKEAQAVVADALLKQATEYERRLGELNHNMRMMLDDRKQFFTRDQHDQFESEYRSWKETVNQQLTTIMTWGTAGLFILGIVEFLLRVYWK